MASVRERATKLLEAKTPKERSPAVIRVDQADAKMLRVVKALVKKGVLHAEVSVFATDFGADVMDLCR